MVTIDESGMTFGPYPDEHCFQIEKSLTYKTLQQGVQMAEFLFLHESVDKPAQVWIVEAKSSSPRPEPMSNFDAFIQEIRNKLTNALALAIASCLKRHVTAEGELSRAFKNLDLATAGFRLVLVINGHKDEWLPPLQDALVKILRPTVRTWAMGPNAIAVLNEHGARRFGLIR